MKQSSVIFPILLVMLLVVLLVPTAFAAEETVCIQCHGGLDGLLAEPVGQWQTSVHAANGISCHDCHGGDPTDYEMAMTPERGFVGVPEYNEVPEFCGKCHLGVKDDYLASAHGQALDAGGAQCVICHENHAIQLANIDLINQDSCSRCHDYERAELIKQEISATEETLAKLETSVASLHRVGIDTERLKEDLFSSRNSFRRLFHTVNIDKIKSQTENFDEELSETKTIVAGYENSLGQRKLVGGAIVLLLLLGGCIALLIRRSYHDEE
jgi:nitrate/TMAO reductase-like tetraheme cytochrome c subunit